MDEDDGAWYIPDMFCTAVEVEYYGEYMEDRSHCYGTEFAGGWFQPSDSDWYDTHFRFSPGMTGEGMCMSKNYGEESMDYGNVFSVEGAATLVAGVSVIALAMSI